MAPKDEAILIVGAGTFGLSTAFELARNGYQNITVLDRASQIPSPYSAGCDLNKIIRAEYEEPFYTDLALEAIKAWQTPFFKPYYVESGVLIANSAAAGQDTRGALSKAFSSIEHHPAFPVGSFKQIKSGQDVKSIAPQLRGDMTSWTGYFNKHGGYARAARAMARVHDACKEMGVRFHLGENEGHATELFFEDNERQRCIGVKTICGKEYRASHTILCLGAHVARLLPAIAPQITAKAWSVAHLQLSSEQARSMAGIPVVNCRDMGFFFEPDPETNLLKLCAHSAGVTNYEGGTTSCPTSSGSSDGYAIDHGRIPQDDAAKIVKLIAATMPQFSSLPLTRQFICWCGDTTDSNYIIDFVPGTTEQSLMVFSGDSGHAFKMLPIAGQWAMAALEKGTQDLGRWRWKEISEGNVHDIHWRSGKLKDVRDVDWIEKNGLGSKRRVNAPRDSRL